MKNIYTTKEASDYLLVKVRTLGRWRNKDYCGPKFLKLEGLVRYRKEDLDDFLVKCEFEGRPDE